MIPLKKITRYLNTEVRKLGYNIPPLVNAYMSLSPTMRMFGTAINLWIRRCGGNRNSDCSQ